MFSITYNHPETQTCSILFQKLFQGSSEFAPFWNTVVGARPTRNSNGIQPQHNEVAHGCSVLPGLE
jgi:hypothetical protein